jgi:hypothetical protein
MNAGDIPIHLARIETKKGGWIVDVRSRSSGQNGGHVAVQLLLEHSIDEEHVITRRLLLYVVRHELEARTEHVLDRIRTWIEEEEGDGELNLVAK